MTVIFIQSSFPSIELPPVEWISTDKVIHMGIYALFAILCYISLIHQDRVETFYKSPLIWTFIITSLYGASDEIHQTFVFSRSGELPDWVADVIGAGILVLIIRFFLKNRYNLFKRTEYLSN